MLKQQAGPEEGFVEGQIGGIRDGPQALDGETLLRRQGAQPRGRIGAEMNAKSVGRRAAVRPRRLITRRP